MVTAAPDSLKSTNIKTRGHNQGLVVRTKQDKTGKTSENVKSIFDDGTGSDGESQGKREGGNGSATRTLSPLPRPIEAVNSTSEQHDVAQSHTMTRKIGEVGKLGASAYRPFGSDIGSDSTCCKGGPGMVTCGNPVEDGQSGIFIIIIIITSFIVQGMQK